MSFLKTNLKRVFPLKLLKKAFLVYNIAKIYTVDKVFFSEVKLLVSNFISHRYETPFEHIDLSDLIEPTKSHMAQWLTWQQDDFIVHSKFECVIEPLYGWAIVGSNKLMFESLSFSRTNHQRKPNLIEYWSRKNVEYFDKVISLRDTGEENYFHFYNDVLSKLFWLEQNGVEINSIPIVISHKLWSKAYFQSYYAQSPLLRALRWVIQRNQYIVCKEAYFVKAPTHSASLWNSALSPLLQNSEAKPVRIFVSRKKERLRFLENESEIFEICRNHAIDIIDNDELSLEEQVRVFSKAELIVGIHGAGLTNICFSSSGCKVLEIFPSLELGYLPFHYLMLAKMKGLKYNAIIGDGENGRFSGGFYLPANKFSKVLSDML